MILRDRAPKRSASGQHREVTAAATLDRVAPCLSRIGVTRIGDITGLDRLGIPVYTAVVPRSADTLSVYNGKGVTAADARASAVMEAVERFCAWQPRTAAVVSSYDDLMRSGHAALDPATCCLAPDPRYRPDLPISWVTGTELNTRRGILVPARLAGHHHHFPEIGVHRISTTTGLASGNSVEEAVCHALCEIVERDDWTMADLVSNRLRQTVAKLGRDTTMLTDRHPTIDLATLPPAAQELAEKFAKAGVRLILRNLSTVDGVAAVAAITVEHVADSFSGAHAGYAAHPDAEVAVLRAITEVAQSRAVDIQGMREDLDLPDADVETWNLHTRRGSPDLSVWPYPDSDEPASFADLPHHPSDDVMADVRRLLGVLAARGVGQVVAVDLTPPWLPVSVVRVIAPGAESFGIDHSRLGPRAGKQWDASLRALIAGGAR